MNPELRNWPLMVSTKMPLRLTEVWPPSARAPSILPMNILLVSIALGLILWNRMVVTKRPFLWPNIGLPVWMTIKKFANKFRAYISLGLKVMRTMAATQKLFLAFPNWLSYSLKRSPLRLKLSAFTTTG